jgi:hypothetical protein
LIWPRGAYGNRDRRLLFLDRLVDRTLSTRGSARYRSRARDRAGPGRSCAVGDDDDFVFLRRVVRDDHLRGRSGLGLRFNYNLFFRLRFNHVELNWGRRELRGLNHNRRGLGGRHVVDNDLHRRFGHGLVGDIDRPLGGLLLLAAPCFLFRAPRLFFLCRAPSGCLFFGAPLSCRLCRLTLSLSLPSCSLFGSLALSFHSGLLLRCLAGLFISTLPLKLLHLPACLFGSSFPGGLFLGSTLGYLFGSLATRLFFSLAACFFCSAG